MLLKLFDVPGEVTVDDLSVKALAVGSGRQCAHYGDDIECGFHGEHLKCFVLNQYFGDLDSVQRGAFAEVIRNNPEVQAVGDGFILPDAAAKRVIFAGGVQGQRVTVFRDVVNDGHAGRLGEQGDRLGAGDFLFGFDVDRFAVAADDRDAHTG